MCYADDFVLGFIGPKAEAEKIKESLATFLRDTLKLDLSKDKTLITHATSLAAKFLEHELVNQQANDKRDHTGKRSINGGIGLQLPAKVIDQHCRAYMRNGKPAHRALRDLNVKGRGQKPQWVRIMAARQRKTLVVCRTCHMNIHYGQK